MFGILDGSRKAGRNSKKLYREVKRANDAERRATQKDKLEGMRLQRDDLEVRLAELKAAKAAAKESSDV
jgi:hypothetical protein